MVAKPAHGQGGVDLMAAGRGIEVSSSKQSQITAGISKSYAKMGLASTAPYSYYTDQGDWRFRQHKTGGIRFPNYFATFMDFSCQISSVSQFSWGFRV
jgi:hypothetical protein